MDKFKNNILKEIRKWEQESMSSNCPMVFISYAYDNDEHRLWVRNLRDRLRADGINAITDESLPTGYPLNLFMEQILASKQLAFVVCVVSTQYVQKANSGVGGVGYEQAIMTRELTTSVGDNKILPILRENPEGETPSFLGTKKYVDFRNDDNFEDVCWELERDIFEFPKMPPLGKRPEWAVNDRVAIVPQREGAPKKNDERAKIAKFIERIPDDALQVLIEAKDANGEIVMVNAHYNALPRSLVVGNLILNVHNGNDNIGERAISYLIKKGLVERIHKDWKSETYILSDGAHEFLERAKEYELI